MLTLFTNGKGNVPTLDEINDGITLVPTTVEGQPAFKVYNNGCFMETITTPGYGPNPIKLAPPPVRVAGYGHAPEPPPPTWKVHVTHGPGAGLRFTVFAHDEERALPHDGVHAIVKAYRARGSRVEVYSPDGDRRPLMED